MNCTCKMKITKCIADGNCLFHAISNCCFEKYRHLNREQKQQFALDLRAFVRSQISKPKIQELIQDRFPLLFLENKPAAVFASMRKELEGRKSLFYHFAFIFALIHEIETGEKIDFIFVRNGRPMLFMHKDDVRYGIIVVKRGHYDCVEGLHSPECSIIKALGSKKPEK